MAMGSFFIIEANLKSFRTVPFVSKAIGKPVAKIATQLMQGSSLKDINFKSGNYSKISSSERSCYAFQTFSWLR